MPHPRWSQATEEVIGTGERRPTLLFNGYGEYVADLYKGLDKERLWAVSAPFRNAVSIVMSQEARWRAVVRTLLPVCSPD